MTRFARPALAVTLVALLAGALMMLGPWSDRGRRTHVTAYFDNTTGLYPGDDVRILGIPVGKVETIAPGPAHAKVTFWVDRRYPVPAGADAVILAPALVSARTIQLTPAYTGGPQLADGAVIPQERTAVPVEWDDLRAQLNKLTDTLQPSTPGGVAPLGALINTGAANLRGEGTNIREALQQVSQAFSALGDHSTDLFSTVKHLSLLVSALRSSSDVLGQVNGNLAEVTRLLDSHPGQIAAVVHDLDTAVGDVSSFVAADRDTAGTTVDKLTELSNAVTASLDDIKQGLHVAPNTLDNFTNVYYPSTGSLAAQDVLPNFANPVQFICGAIQAASRMNYEQSAKLCVQYLAPIMKNRQYNFPPVGATTGLASIPLPTALPGGLLPLPFSPFLLPLLLPSVSPIPIPLAGAMARPNEITYSEDRLRPDHIPDPPAPGHDPLAQLLMPAGGGS